MIENLEAIEIKKPINYYSLMITGENWEVRIREDNGAIEVTGNPVMDEVAKTFWQALADLKNREITIKGNLI